MIILLPKVALRLYTTMGPEKPASCSSGSRKKLDVPIDMMTTCLGANGHGVVYRGFGAITIGKILEYGAFFCRPVKPSTVAPALSES